MYKRFIKRVLDIIISGTALLLLGWLILILMLLVRIKLGSPVFFYQERPGKDERIFRLFKFRTMTDARDENGELLPDEARLTKFGSTLRKLSLDELPELINIFKGDMSLIGPRPLLKEYLPWYNDRERLRHSVRPGLTGLAQVNGRNNLNWEDRFETDVRYVENLTFVMDLKIFLKTIAVVFKHSDVAEDTNKAEGNFARMRKAQLENRADD